MEDLLARASTLLEENRFGDAAALLEAQGQQQCDYRNDLLLAAALDGSNQRNDAKQVLAAAHSVWPSNCSVAASLARYDVQAGETARAETVVSRCVPTDTTAQRELRMIALVELENQKLTRAGNMARIAYDRQPSEENLLFLANVLQLQGRYMEVVSLLGKQRATYRDSAGFLITLAESESDAKMYAAAGRDLRHALALDPGSYPAHYVLGNLLVTTGRLSQGIAEFQRAIQLSPRQPRTYFQVGKALEQEGHPAAAWKYFHLALAAGPHYAPAYCEMGKLELRQNQPRSAAEHLQLAIQYNPSLHEAYYFLMQAYFRLGERDKSRQVLAEWNSYRKAHPMRAAGSAAGTSVPHAPGSPSQADSRPQ